MLGEGITDALAVAERLMWVASSLPERQPGVRSSRA